jgi:Na+-transporting NADH:ubiquinone oxidoreductase subunit NqrB
VSYLMGGENSYMWHDHMFQGCTIVAKYLVIGCYIYFGCNVIIICYSSATCKQNQTCLITTVLMMYILLYRIPSCN